MKCERTFNGTPDSAAQARRFVARELVDVDSAARSSISVMVSELATNAILHASTNFQVVIERHPGRVRIEVSDSGDGAPTMRAPTVLEPTGRGLRIVEELADEWGVESAPPGKTVWFVLRTPLPTRVGR